MAPPLPADETETKTTDSAATEETNDNDGVNESSVTSSSQRTENSDRGGERWW